MEIQDVRTIKRLTGAGGVSLSFSCQFNAGGD